jgi:hypothetical protein
VRSAIEVALLIIVPVTLLLAILRVPRWFSRSLHRHRLWRLRDQVVDDVIDERLPREHPAVRELMEQAEQSIRLTSSLTMVDFYAWSWAMRGAEPHLIKPRQPAPLHGLSPAQRRMVENYRARLRVLRISAILSGSWLGIASVLRFVIPAIPEVRRTLRAEDRARSDGGNGSARDTSITVERKDVQMPATPHETDAAQSAEDVRPLLDLAAVRLTFNTAAYKASTADTWISRHARAYTVEETNGHLSGVA